MKNILLITVLAVFSAWSARAQIDFKNASKEEVAKFYASLPTDKVLKDFRLNPEINPEVKVLDADSSTVIKAKGEILYEERWLYSYYLQTIAPTGVYHGWVDQGKHYVLMISANRQRGLIFLKTAKGYESLAPNDIAWIRGKLFELKDAGQGLIIARIIHVPSQRISDSFIVIDLVSKNVETFD